MNRTATDLRLDATGDRLGWRASLHVRALWVGAWESQDKLSLEHLQKGPCFPLLSEATELLSWVPKEQRREARH